MASFVDEDIERQRRQEAGISEESWAALQALLGARPKGYHGGRKPGAKDVKPRTRIAKYDKPCVDCGTLIARNGRCFACMNEYNRSRYHNDPEYRAKRIEQAKRYSKKRYAALTPDAKQHFKSQVNAARLKRQFGITKDEYDALFEKQFGRCKICGAIDEKRALRVDHNHKTGEVRGLLCHNCNVAIGLLHDDNVLIHTVASYVEGSI